MKCPICDEEFIEQYVLRGDIVTGIEWECPEGDGTWTKSELIKWEDGL